MSTPEPRQLPNGHVQYDCGPCSCLSCGGRATVTIDTEGRESQQCAHCGDVVYVVLTDDRGYPVQGYIRPAELRWLPDDLDDGAEIPF